MLKQRLLSNRTRGSVNVEMGRHGVARERAGGYPPRATLRQERALWGCAGRSSFLPLAGASPSLGRVATPRESLPQGAAVPCNRRMRLKQD